MLWSIFRKRLAARVARSPPCTVSAAEAGASPRFLEVLVPEAWRKLLENGPCELSEPPVALLLVGDEAEDRRRAWRG